MNEGREDPWNVKNEISRETVTYGNIRRSMKRGRKKKKRYPSSTSRILHHPFHTRTFVLIQSHSPRYLSFSPFLFLLILEEGKPSSVEHVVHARADQSHLLRRSVTEHVTSVHLVRVPTASRCQPHRSRTGRDACPPLIVYPNETKRSDRTGRLETHPSPSPSQFRASTCSFCL